MTEVRNGGGTVITGTEICETGTAVVGDAVSMLAASLANETELAEIQGTGRLSIGPHPTHMSNPGCRPLRGAFGPDSYTSLVKRRNLPIFKCSEIPQGVRDSVNPGM